jgi:hypothetical protein
VWSVDILVIAVPVAFWLFRRKTSHSVVLLNKKRPLPWGYFLLRTYKYNDKGLEIIPINGVGKYSREYASGISSGPVLRLGQVLL